MRAFDGLAVAGLIALLTWLLFKGLSPVDPRLTDALRGLDAYAASESALHRDVLSAHAGLLNNYDPLDGDLHAMRGALHRIVAHRVTLAEQSQGGALLVTFRAQEAAANRFKSGNALVQNSLAYFASYSGVVAAKVGRTRARAAVDRLSSAMLHLSLDGSLDAQADVEAAIAGLGRACRQVACGREARGLLAHGRLLKRLIPDLAARIEGLVRSGSDRPVRHLRLDLQQQQETAEAAAARFRVLLYLASLLLVYLLVRWGVQVRSHATALRRQLILEHAVSRLSTQLIAAAPDSITRVVQDALADLGRALGASHARFFHGRNGETCAWPDPEAVLPACGPQWVAGHVAPLGDHGHGVVHVVRAALPVGSPQRIALKQIGVESCYCILPPREGDNCNLLAFGFATARSDWAMAQLAVLRTALDAISLSLDHAHLARERARLEAQLGHARRMETVGAFASGIAHNFNNLLGAIAGHVEMAAESADDAGLVRAHIEQIGVSAERGRQLVRSLLSYGRRHENQREAIDLDALVLESCNLVQAALTPVYRIDFRPDAHGAFVMADAVQLQQVILNLCHNAAQAMADGGVVLVRTERRHSGDAAGTEVAALVIADSGCGIAPDLLPKVFEPFFTTRPSGTGLGLSTARDIIAGLGGELTLESTPDQGTTALIALPSGGPGPSTLLGQGETILYLADSMAECLAGEDLLAALGYEPVGFADVGEALAVLEAAPERFHAVIVAGESLGNARAMLGRARLLCPATPRILAVRHYGAHSASALADAGVSSLLQFPLDARALALMLRRALVRGRL